MCVYGAGTVNSSGGIAQVEEETVVRAEFNVKLNIVTF